jgi:hypothetical protein
VWSFRHSLAAIEITWEKLATYATHTGAASNGQPVFPYLFSVVYGDATKRDYRATVKLGI